MYIHNAKRCTNVTLMTEKKNTPKKQTAKKRVAKKPAKKAAAKKPAAKKAVAKKAAPKQAKHIGTIKPNTTSTAPANVSVTWSTTPEFEKTVTQTITNVTNVIRANDVKTKNIRTKMLQWFRRSK